MRHRIISSVIAFILLAACFQIGAQETILEQAQRTTALKLLDESRGQIVRIHTAGGGEFQGTLSELLSDRIELVDSEGLIIQIAKDQVERAIIIDPAAERSTFYQDAAANRLIVMPTGFGMEPEEFHIAVQEIIAVTASYGVSNNFSLWGGVSIPGALLNGRFSVNIGESVGLSAGSFVGVSWIEWVGIVLPYTIISVGNVNQNVTAALGMPVVLSYERGIRIAGVLGAIAGKIVLSPKASIIAENWILLLDDYGEWDGTPLFFIPGIVFRIAGSRFSWDIGAVLPMLLDHGYDGDLTFGGVIGDIFPLPLLSFTYRIN